LEGSGRIPSEATLTGLQKLRYKDYQLASRPAEVKRENSASNDVVEHIASGLHETESVKDFGLQMQARGVYSWWRKGMGYAGQDERL